MRLPANWSTMEGLGSARRPFLFSTIRQIIPLYRSVDNPAIQGTIPRRRWQDVGLPTGEPVVPLRSKMLALSTIPVVVLIFAVVYAVSAQRTASRTNAEVDRTNTVRQLLAEIQIDLGVAES